ncbi:MAG: riboflavin synthase [Thermodesulfobacteriota bacterium]
MFTGIVEDKGRVVRVESKGRGRRLILQIPHNLTDIQPGDSININGVCLTVTEKKEEVFQFDLSEETITKSTLGGLREGDSVNLERALRFTDRLGGHIVTGHIDGIGTVVDQRRDGEFIHLTVKLPREVLPYVVPKGSIAIDGVSLTVNQLREDEVQISLIPFTLERTNLIEKKIGDRVNIEADILGKYVESILRQREKESKGLSLSFLKEHGFIKEE